MKYVVLIGRIFFCLIFLNSGIFHFAKQTIAYGASNGVPMASFVVPFAGVMAIVGAISIILGYKAKWGAWLLVAFLVPITLVMHRFWSITDSNMHMMQMTMFMKNLSMLGGALMITFFGSGPLSLDNRKG